jgi:hypothetical protein
MNLIRLVAGVLVYSGLAMTARFGAAQAAEPLCDYGSDTFAPMNMDNYDGCVLRRDSDVGKGGAIVLSDASVFATTCPVTIRLNDHPTQCRDDLMEALEKGDVFRIDEWSKDHLQFTLVRGSKIIVSGKLNPLIEEIGGSKRRLGYYLDTMVKSNGQTRPARYNIYLSHIKQNGQAVRYYSIEVFEESQLCRNEMPNNNISRYSKDCRNVAVELPPTVSGDGQLPSGGGGEPPPKN